VRIAALCSEVRLGAGNEEAANIVEPSQSLEVDLGSVHNVEGTGFCHEVVEDVEGDDRQIGSSKGRRQQGNEAVGGKDAPALYFGTTKFNNNFDIVDAVGKEDGQGMTATLFVKGGDEFIRVSTGVPKPDGSGRAIGTVLAGPALESIKAGRAHCGEVPILGAPYMTGYEPIKDGAGTTIGVYYVGYKE
jgi:cache 3/cache 2 fusion protein